MRRRQVLGLLATCAFPFVLHAQGNASLIRAGSFPRPQSDEDGAFIALGQAYLDGTARINPVAATALGDHRFDHLLPDMSAQGRTTQLGFLKAIRTKLARINRARLARDHQVDAALLANELNRTIWTLEVERGWAWDPQLYQSIAGGALYSLAARDFAPWSQRLKAATSRMERLPGLLAQMRASLIPAKVPPIYATTVASQNMGTLELAESVLGPNINALSDPDKSRFNKALEGLKLALTTHQKWLDTVLVPQAKGEFRVEPALYDRKLAFAMVGAVTRPELKARATSALAATREEMYSLSRQILAGRPGAPPTPEQPDPAGQQAAIAAALELSYARAPARDKVMDEARATMAQATDFVRRKDLVTLPDSPVKVVEVPKFMQGVAVAYCDSPGPLDRHLETFYMVSPIPADWTDEQTTSYLREYNHYMIHDLSIHEAMPGHYLQIAHANKHPSTLRAVLASGPFIEGWAVYAEALMSDAGYLADDPLFRLTVLKMRLRTITNTLLDIGIHTEGLTREQAMTMMMEGAFQQEREASGKWVRAQLGSTQLLSYFTGYSEHLALRSEAERRQGSAFSLKAYHDALLSHGSPPVHFARALLLGEAIPSGVVS
jgi:uncharacterized protein (DUF885 family)